MQWYLVSDTNRDFLYNCLAQWLVSSKNHRCKWKTRWNGGEWREIIENGVWQCQNVMNTTKQMAPSWIALTGILPGMEGHGLPLGPGPLASGRSYSVLLLHSAVFQQLTAWEKLLEGKEKQVPCGRVLSRWFLGLVQISLSSKHLWGSTFVNNYN